MARIEIIQRLVARICVASMGVATWGCNANSPTEEDGVALGRSRQALTSEQARVLGFEALGDWTTNNGTLSVGSSASQGSASVGLSASGWAEVNSGALSTLDGVADSLSVDVRLPQSAPWGEVRVVLLAPSLGMYWTELGSRPLTGVTPGQFETFTFSLSSPLQAALSATYSDLTIKVVVNAPSLGGPVLLDNLVLTEEVDPTPEPEPDPGVPPVEEDFVILVPQGVPLSQTFMSATDHLSLYSQANAGALGGTPAIANFGSGEYFMQAEAEARANVYSSGPVRLDVKTEIYGFLQTQASLTEQGLWTDSNGVVQRTADAPVIVGGVHDDPVQPSVRSWSVPWPSSVGPDIELFAVNQPTATTIPPGAYGDYNVYDRNIIHLSSGTYFFDTFNMEQEAELRLDTSDGPVVVYVRNDLPSAGLRVLAQVYTDAGDEAQLLLGFLGTGDVVLQGPFQGTVVAPDATIKLERPNDPVPGPHKGSFFGRAIEVAAGNHTVEHVPFAEGLPPSDCLLGDTDGDEVDDCSDECIYSDQKSVRGDCGCDELDIDSDGDNVMDCLDGCPLDPAQTRRGTCGCSDAPAPQGTPCADGLLCEESVCDGSGICGTVQDGAPEPEGCFARERDGRLYWVCQGALSWQDAQDSCAAIEGRALVQLGSDSENRFVANLLDGASAWIGANDLSDEGSFSWASTDGPEGTLFWQDGARVGNLFDAWSDRGFDSVESDDCVALTGLRWNEGSCSETRAYVCESRSASGCGPMPPETTCGQFHPGRDCTTGLPGGSGGECIDQVEGSDFDEALAQFQAEYDACFDGCAPGDTFASCVDACTGALEVPEAGSTCAEPLDALGNPIDDGHERVCEMAHFDVDTECDSDADCTLPDHICVMYYEPDCRGCDEIVDDKCVRLCLGKTVCALPSGDCDGGEPALCREVEICEEDDHDPSFSDPSEGDGANLIPEEYLPDDDFPPPATERPDDESFPEDPACASPPCAKNDPNHPWCAVDVLNDGVEPGEDPPNDMGTRDINKTKSGRSGDGNLVSFSFDPQTILEYSATPHPFGALDFELHAGASFLASTEFRMLGAHARLDLLDARVKLDAELCFVSTEDTRIEVMGHDFLPQLIEVYNEQTGQNVIPDDIVFRKPDRVGGEISQQEQDCIDAFDTYLEAVDRAKKALRDVEELIRQHEELVAHNESVAADPDAQLKRFETEFCESVAKNPPKGFPALDCATNPDPEVVINAFIDYYRTVATTYLDNALRGMVSKSFNASKTIELFDVRKDISENVVTAQFAVGPIPCVLEIDVFMHYGLSGDMRYEFLPGNLIGMNDIARDLVWLRTQATPSAGAGISLFVGAGGGVPGFNASVGIYGEVNLADLELPMWAGAGIQAAAEPDPRAEDLDVLFPFDGVKQYTFNARYEVGAEARITNILAANLGVRLKIQFLWFSVKYKKALLTLDGFDAPPIPLIHGGGTSQSAELAPKWAVVRMPFYLPDVPHLPPGQLPAAGDNVDEVAFSDELSAELFYDSQCTCAALEEDCFRNDDCCGNAEDGTGTNVCFLNMGLTNDDGTAGRKVCSGCRDVYAECNEPSDCCGGEEEMDCTAESYEVVVGQDCGEPGELDGTGQPILCVDILETVQPTTPVCQPQPGDGGGVAR